MDDQDVSAASLMPPSAPPPNWHCGGAGAFFDMPTVWWTEQDKGLVITISINFTISCSCMLTFLVLSRVPSLRRSIYSPRGDAPWAPHTWWEVLRQGSRSAPLTNADASSLDRTMLLRYLRFNLKLFGTLSLVALPIMLPLNAVRLHDGTGEVIPPPPDHEKQAWGGLESLAITHLPPGSPRYLAPTIFMMLFTLLFFSLLQQEWKAYLRLRHEWLAQPRPEALTVLLQLGKRRLSAEEVGVRLRKLWPAEVHAVLPVRRQAATASSDGVYSTSATRARGGGQRGLCERLPTPELYTLTLEGDRSFPVLQAALLPPDTTAEAASSASSATPPTASAAAGGAAPTPPAADVSGEAIVADLATATKRASSYLVLFRTRRAASACARAAPVFSRDGGPTTTSAAPHPCDMHWRALEVRRSRAKLVWLLGWALTLLLFLLWTGAAALVQGLVSLDTLERLFNQTALGERIADLDESSRATLGGWVATLTLSLLQMATLYSGVLGSLAEMMGPASYTLVSIRTLTMMWAFNTFLVLLGSCIVTSALNTIDSIVQGGGCALVHVLADSVPSRSTFFLNLVFQDLLLVAPTLDLLQLLPLLLLALQRCLRCCCCCLRCVRSLRPLEDKLLQLATGEPTWVALGQRLYYEYIYSRAMMVTSIGTLFGCIAPITIVVVAVWLYLLLPVWSHNLSHVLRPYPQGHGFDGGGLAWPHAVRMQMYVLLIAQFVLAAIQLLYERYYSAAAALLLLPASVLAFNQLRDYYGPLAAHLPLQDAAQIDAAVWAQSGGGTSGDGNGVNSGRVLAEGQPLPDELMRLLTAAEEAYAGAGVGGGSVRLLQEQHEQQAIRSSNSLGGRDSQLPHEVAAAAVL